MHHHTPGLYSSYSITSLSAAEQRRRHREAERLRGLQIDKKLECRWLLHRQISRHCTFEDFVHVCGSALVQVEKARAISQQNSSASPGPIKTDGDQSALQRKFGDRRSVQNEQRATKNRERLRSLPDAVNGRLDFACRACFHELKLETGATRCLG